MSPGISEETIRHVARLARIEIDEARIRELCVQLQAILAYFDKLNRLDTSAVEPLARAVELAGSLANDEPRPSLPTAEALAAAPDRDGSYFKVPKVLGDS